MELFLVIVQIEIWIMNDSNPALILYRNANDNSNEMQVSFDEAFGSVKWINPDSRIFWVKCFKVAFDL